MVVAGGRPACSHRCRQVRGDACGAAAVCPTAARRPGGSGWQRGTQRPALWKLPLAPGPRLPASLISAGCRPFTAEKAAADVFLLFMYRLLAPDRPIHPEAARGPSQPPATVSPLQTRLLLPPALSSFCQQDGGSSRGRLLWTEPGRTGFEPSGTSLLPDCASYTLLSRCPGAAITKDHKLGGCEQQDFILSPRGQKSKTSV